jgi:isopenicillin N synthase-like dioxygenase
LAVSVTSNVSAPRRFTSPNSRSEGDGERISVPFFFNPNYAAQIPEFDLPPELAARATGVTVDANNPIHDSYGANALKSRLRAHPDVAARWWPDIVAAQSAT